jgi:hypothetical protein
MTSTDEVFGTYSVDVGTVNWVACLMAGRIARLLAVR